LVEGRLWRLFDEAFGIGLKARSRVFWRAGIDLVGLTVVDLVRRHEADAGVVMILIVPIEKLRQNILASSMQPNR